MIICILLMRKLRVREIPSRNAFENLNPGEAHWRPQPPQRHRGRLPTRGTSSPCPFPFGRAIDHIVLWPLPTDLKPGGRLCFVLISAKSISENDGIGSLCSSWPYQRTELDLCWVSTLSPGTMDAALKLCQFLALQSGGPSYLLHFVLWGFLIGVFLLLQL